MKGKCRAWVTVSWQRWKVGKAAVLTLTVTGRRAVSLSGES